MDHHDSSSKYAPGKKPGNSDRMRVLVLGGLLLVVGGLFFFTRDDDRQPTADLRPLDGLNIADPNEPSATKIDPTLLESVADSTAAERVTMEPEALWHLLIEANRSVVGDFRRLEARPLNDTLYATIAAHPESYRGQPFTAKGLMTGLREESVTTDLAGTGSGFRQSYWTVMAQAEDGSPFAFSMLNEPTDVEVGDVLRLDGFFMKLRVFPPEGSAPAEEPGDRNGQQSTALEPVPVLQLVGKNVAESFFHMPPVTELDFHLIDTIADYDIKDRLQIEEEPLYHMLSYLDQVDGDLFSTYATDLTAYSLRKDPQQHRGRPVRVLGTFYGDSWGIALGPGGENPLDLDGVRHGLLVHGGPTFTYLISAEREPDWVREAEGVIAVGLFFKNYVYTTEGRGTMDCPLLVIKRFEPFEVDTEAASNLPAYAIMSIGALFLGWFFLSAMGDRKATADFRRRYYAHRKQQVREGLGPSEEA